MVFLMLVMLFQSISRGYVSWKRVKEVLHTQPELKDGKSWKIQIVMEW